MSRVLILAAVLPVVSVTGWVFWKWNTRKTRVVIDTKPPADFPADRFDHAAFENCLTRFAVGGRIDYESWHRDTDARRQLASYLAAVGRYGPSSSPTRFADESDVLAYWMYAYNAMVIHAVLDRWPLESVTDVRAPVELIRGLGFFYTLEFRADGEWFTLYDLEHEKVMAAGDPRVHFVLNCASEACPAIRPDLPTGDDLEPFLQKAAREFVEDHANVSMDERSNVVKLSPIFKWYEKDFINDLRRRGLPSSRGIVDYVAHVAPTSISERLNGGDYRVEFVDYDWRINSGAG